MLKISRIKISILVAIVVAIALWFSGESILQLPQRVDFSKVKFLEVKPVQTRTDIPPVLIDAPILNSPSKVPTSSKKTVYNRLQATDILNIPSEVPTSRLVIYEDEESHFKKSLSVIDISSIPVSAELRREALSSPTSCRTSLVRELRSAWSRYYFAVYDFAYGSSYCWNLTAPVGDIKIVIDGRTYDLMPIFSHVYAMPLRVREALGNLSSERVEIRLFDSPQRSEHDKSDKPTLIVTLNPATVRVFKEIYCYPGSSDCKSL